VRPGPILLLCLLALPANAIAGTAWLQGGNLAVPVVNMQQARFQGVVRQQQDYSCGAASVATLLTFHYGDAVDEATVLEGMLHEADRAVVERQGFSMLDMKRFLEARGYPADGFRAGLEALADTHIPAIVLINLDGYRHFVVIKGITDNQVLVGDPALGVRVHERAHFAEIWNGLLFVIRDRMDLAGETFNDAATWGARTGAPLEAALQQQGIGGFLLGLPRPGDY